MARRNNRLAAVALSQGMVDPMRLAKAVEPWLVQSGVDDWLQFFLDKELLTPEQAERLRNAYAAADPDTDSETDLQSVGILERVGTPALQASPDRGEALPRTLNATPSEHFGPASPQPRPELDPHGHAETARDHADLEVDSEASDPVAVPAPHYEDWMREEDTLLGLEKDDDGSQTHITAHPAPRHVQPPPPRPAPASRSMVAEAGRRAGVILPGAEASAPSFPSERKYTLQREVGRGGVARVFEALDNDVGRRVAIKVLRDPARATPRMLEKLIEEAQITGQLEHPNIVPVHDLGLLPSGEVFFAMKLLRGRTLAELVRQLRVGNEEVAKEFSRLRLLTFFQQINMAIAFAHERGVIHRDLKPENILIGYHGEVSVMDWGLARVAGRKERQSSEGTVRTLRSEGGGSRTVVGTISGTPSYMPPEQAMGNVFEIDVRSDVYSLGAILYELLTLYPPFTGRNAADILTKVVSDPVVPPRERAPTRQIPTELEEICLHALAKKKDDRYDSARALHADVEAYLEGTRERKRKRAEAGLRIVAGREAQARYEEVREELSRLDAAAREAERKTRPSAPPSAKRRLWELQDLRTESHGRLAEAFASAVEAYSQALGIDPSADEARDTLAELYLERLGEAEALGQPETALHFHSLLEHFAAGRYAQRLGAPGRLRIATTPEGARVSVFRYRARNRIENAEEELADGRTPMELSLPPGSYLVVLELDGFAPVRVPVTLTREAHSELKIPLRTREELGEAFTYIPAGSYLSGGDALAPNPVERHGKYVKAYAIGTYPVTVEEYLEFVNDVCRTDPEEAQRRTPRATSTAGFYWSAQEGGGFAIASPDPDGDVWEPRWPVMGVSWQDAVAYCAWYSRRCGAIVRLPTREEWEKAARGVDGRLYPWGNHFDPTFCKMESSREGRPLPEPVGSYPTDESPYGVRDLAGTIEEWTAGRFLDDENLRTLCGSSWRSPSLLCRTTWETGASPASVSLSYGFRLAKPL